LVTSTASHYGVSWDEPRYFYASDLEIQWLSDFFVGLFQGVLLSAREHRVEFKYQPRSITIGTIISLMTLLSIVIWSILVFAINGKKDKLAKP